MITASYCPYVLNFKFLAQTSRESMRQRPTWLIRLHESNTGTVVYGECALFPGLSEEPLAGYEEAVAEACRNPLEAVEHPYSSIRFGFETALRNLAGTPDDAWHRGEYGIPINGLIWMGDKNTMRERICEKLEAGFDVLKLKIGGINFEDEVDLLRLIRSSFKASDLTIRLDANGSFTPKNALERLRCLSEFNIHSLEQPIKQGQWEEMAKICAESPIPVALDEELIGTTDLKYKSKLLNEIKPQFIILKPSLCGGFSGTREWIKTADERGIGYWLTSALESNVGLEAIASYAANLACKLPQGLGTGQLYTNNFESPLELRGQYLYRDMGCSGPNVRYDLESLPWRN